jgi:hypothetical protein
MKKTHRLFLKNKILGQFFEKSTLKLEKRIKDAKLQKIINLVDEGKKGSNN